MKIKVANLTVDYSDTGKGAILLFLHGWSKNLNKERYLKLTTLLSKKFRIIALDFPGFGNSDPSPTPWGVTGYAKLVTAFLKKLDLKPMAIIGHSFGGRVAIKLTATGMFRPQKLILIDTAGIERPGLKVKILRLLSRHLPRRIKNRYGKWFQSQDYRQSSAVLRQSIKLILAENLEPDISHIKTPTCLIWGSQDNTTPLWQAQIINKLIKNSKLITVDGENHGLPYNNPPKTAQIVTDFLA